MVAPSVAAALVTVALGVIGAAARYVFNVRLVRESYVEDEYGPRFDTIETRLDEISDRLDEQADQLAQLESLVIGNEYNPNGGLVELIEENSNLSAENEERIEALERDLEVEHRTNNSDDDDS